MPLIIDCKCLNRNDGSCTCRIWVAVAGITVPTREKGTESRDGSELSRGCDCDVGYVGGAKRWSSICKIEYTSSSISSVTSFTAFGVRRRYDVPISMDFEEQHGTFQSKEAPERPPP